MPTETLTISPIKTVKDGGYTWTVNGVSYYTGKDGKGLFKDSYETFYNTATNQAEKVYSGLKQVEGTTQFSLAGRYSHARRNNVITYHVRQTESYEPWLWNHDLRDNQNNALNFYQHLQHHYGTCCQVIPQEEIFN